MRERTFDCVVLDLRLPDISGFELLRRLQADAALRETAVIVFTGQGTDRGRGDADLRSMAKSIVLKGVQSPERLLDETALFLHRVIARLPESKQRMLQRCTKPTRRCWARTCSWSTTTCATSLR